jgi:hypothetical protein
VVSELGEREPLLVSAWLTGLRSARTRRAYAGDVADWLGWLGQCARYPSADSASTARCMSASLGRV